MPRPPASCWSFQVASLPTWSWRPVSVLGLPGSTHFSFSSTLELMGRIYSFIYLFLWLLLFSLLLLPCLDMYMSGSVFYYCLYLHFFYENRFICLLYFARTLYFARIISRIRSSQNSQILHSNFSMYTLNWSHYSNQYLTCTVGQPLTCTCENKRKTLHRNNANPRIH